MANLTLALGAAFLGITLAGCSAGIVSAVSGSTGGGTREESVSDPSFNMVAATFTVPAKWRFAGQHFAAGNCGTIPYFVFRASSPDGLSYVEDPPRLGVRLRNGHGRECEAGRSVHEAFERDSGA
jgi:hypothetical protein